MLFAVRFTDHADRLHIREKFMSAHLEWLTANASTILVAGALRPEPSGPPVGALWVVEAESKAALQSLLETDPFWSNGLRSSVEVLHWFKAFPERKASV